MPDRRFRVLALATHPVQYMTPIFRRMAKHPLLDFQVAFCTLRGAEASHDPEFGANIQWDVPLLDGYSWTHIPNRGSGAESFFGLFNPRLWKHIRSGNYDAVLCFIGYVRATFWIACLASKLSKAAFIFGADATSLTPRDGRKWKIPIKKFFWPHLFRLADQVIVPSSGSRDVMLSLGIPGDRVTLTPYSVDNHWWMQQSSQVRRNAAREAWGAGPDTSVVLFCAKLQPWKRPADLLRAFAKANVSNALLVFAGEGPLRSQLESEAAALGVASSVRFLGFVNQSQLPTVYASADLMVLPSEYEPFAVVVNEAMCCGCPVLASDRVGAARDLVAPVCPEFVFRCGDIDALAGLMKKATSDPVRLKVLGRAALAHIQSWSPECNIAATVEAIRIGVTHAGRCLSTALGDSTTHRAAPAATSKPHE
jgi:glycosyltransferase involved in cell wall biosynthesis